MAVKVEKIINKIHSCSIKASKVAEMMKLNESVFNKVKKVNRNEIENNADNIAIESFDEEEFWKRFQNAYNDDSCEELWNYRVFQDNDDYDNCFVFGCPDSLNLYLVISCTEGRIRVFYAYVDTVGKQEMLWHHSDYNRFEEDLDFYCTYNCYLDAAFNFSADNLKCWRTKQFFEHDVDVLIELCKVFVGNEGIVPKCVGDCDGIFVKFMRKFGYTKKEFMTDISNDFDEVMNDTQWIYDVADRMTQFYTQKGVGKCIGRVNQEIVALLNARGVNESVFNKVKKSSTTDIESSVDDMFGEDVIKDVAKKKGIETVFSRNKTKDYLLDFGAMTNKFKKIDNHVWFKSDECVTIKEDGKDYVLSTLDYLLPEDRILCIWNHCQYCTDNEYLRVTLSSDIQDYFDELGDEDKKLVIKNVIGKYLVSNESVFNKVKKVSKSDIEDEVDNSVIEETVRDLIETYGSDKNYLAKTVEFGCLPPFEQEEGMRNLKKMKAIMHPDKIKRMIFRDHSPFKGCVEPNSKCPTNISIDKEDGTIEVTYWHPKKFLDSYVFYGAYSCDTVPFSSFSKDEQQTILNNLQERCSLMKKPRKKKMLKESVFNKVKKTKQSDSEKIVDEIVKGNLDGIKRLILTEGTRDQEKSQTVYELDIKDYASIPVCFELLDDLGLDDYATADDENGHLYEYGMAKLVIDRDKVEDCSLVFFIVDVYEMYDEIVASVNWSDLADYNEQERIAEELGFTEEDYPSVSESVFNKVKKSKSSDIESTVDDNLMDFESLIIPIVKKYGEKYPYSEGYQYILEDVNGEECTIDGEEWYYSKKCVINKEDEVMVTGLIFYDDEKGQDLVCILSGFEFKEGNPKYVKIDEGCVFNDVSFEDLTKKSQKIIYDNVVEKFGVVSESVFNKVKKSKSSDIESNADKLIGNHYSEKLKKFIWECDDVWQDNERQYVNYDNALIGGRMVERLTVDLPEYIDVDYGDDENYDEITYYNYNDKRYYDTLDEIPIKDFILYVVWFGGDCTDFDRLKPEFQEKIFNSVKLDFEEGDMNRCERELFKKYCLG